MKKKFLALLLAMLMVVSLMPTVALAKGGGPVDYVDAAGTPQQCETTVHVLVSNTEWSNDWMYAASDTTINNSVELKANINLILGDGVTLTINGGISDGGNGYTLTVYGQENQTGILVVGAANGANGANGTDGADGANNSNSAASGADGDASNNDGTVGATGGNGGDGVDGGDGANGADGRCGTFLCST